MTHDRRESARIGRFHLVVALLVLMASVSAWQRKEKTPAGSIRYAVDSAWPKPLPAPKDADGQTHHWRRVGELH